MCIPTLLVSYKIYQNYALNKQQIIMSDDQEESDVKYTSASFSFFKFFHWTMMAALRSEFNLDLHLAMMRMERLKKRQCVRIKVMDRSYRIDRFEDGGNAEKRWSGREWVWRWTGNVLNNQNKASSNNNNRNRRAQHQYDRNGNGYRSSLNRNKYDRSYLKTNQFQNYWDQ